MLTVFDNGQTVDWSFTDNNLNFVKFDFTEQQKAFLKKNAEWIYLLRDHGDFNGNNTLQVFAVISEM